MDPESGSLEAFIDHVRDLAGAYGVPMAEAGEGFRRLAESLPPDARSVGLGATGFGRSVGKAAVAAELEHAKALSSLLATGAISYAEARRQLGLGEENGMARSRRRWEREEVPAEAAPIMGYLRINRDPQRMKTSVYFKDGTLLLRIDEIKDKRSIGQIIVEDLVPRICSGCGKLLETPLCDPCRAEAIADLGDVLRG